VLFADLEWRVRRRAVHGIGILLVCILFRLPVLAFSPFGILAFDLILLFGIWLFTSRCDADSGVARTLAWALRLVAIAESMMTIARGIDIPPLRAADELYTLLVVSALPAVGILFLAARLHSFGLSKVARRVLWVFASWVLGWLVVLLGLGPIPYELVLPYLLVALLLYLGAWIWVFLVMLRLRRTLTVELQEWWLDLEARPRVEWTSYALLGDRRVELVGPDGKVSWFDNHSDASSWLTKRGFCPRDQAMRERLIPEGALMQAQFETG